MSLIHRILDLRPRVQDGTILDWLDLARLLPDGVGSLRVETLRNHWHCADLILSIRGNTQPLLAFLFGGDLERHGLPLLRQSTSTLAQATPSCIESMEHQVFAGCYRFMLRESARRPLFTYSMGSETFVPRCRTFLLMTTTGRR